MPLVGCDAAKTIQGFGVRLRRQVRLEALTGELLAVVEQTMQPTSVSLWLRPPAGAPAARRGIGGQARQAPLDSIGGARQRRPGRSSST